MVTDADRCLLGRRQRTCPKAQLANRSQNTRTEAANKRLLQMAPSCQPEHLHGGLYTSRLSEMVKTRGPVLQTTQQCSSGQVGVAMSNRDSQSHPCFWGVLTSKAFSQTFPPDINKLTIPLNGRSGPEYITVHKRIDLAGVAQFGI